MALGNMRREFEKGISLELEDTQNEGSPFGVSFKEIRLYIPSILLYTLTPSIFCQLQPLLFASPSPSPPQRLLSNFLIAISVQFLWGLFACGPRRPPPPSLRSSCHLASDCLASLAVNSEQASERATSPDSVSDVYLYINPICLSIHPSSCPPYSSSSLLCRGSC